MIRVMEFKTEYRAGKDPVDWVLVAPKGAEFDKTQTWHRVSRIKPDPDANKNVKESASYIDMQAKWSIIGPAYEAWSEGSGIPETGTPLSAWSGLSVEQAKYMVSIGVRTVEDVRDMGESTIEKIRFPNARRLPELAKSWLEGEQVAEKDAKILDMQAKMEAMEEMLAERLNAEPEKKKPGRPKKQTEAA